MACKCLLGGYVQIALLVCGAPVVKDCQNLDQVRAALSILQCSQLTIGFELLPRGPVLQPLHCARLYDATLAQDLHTAQKVGGR